MIARTDFGRNQRVVIGGHLDTVPAHDNLPHRLTDDRVYGRGLRHEGWRCGRTAIGGTRHRPRYDVTYLFYDCEEVAKVSHNGSPSWHRQIPPLSRPTSPS